MQGNVFLLNGIGVFLQYALLVLLYLFLYQILRLMRSDMGVDHLAHPLKRTNARLEVLHAEGASLGENVFPIQGRLAVGRNQENDVVIDDAYVSHDHAVIWRDGGDYWIEDLNSINHTYVNGILLNGKKIIVSGDTIKVGLVTFKFER